MVIYETLLYYIWLCNKTSNGRYKKIILYNLEMSNKSKVWINPIKIREFFIYCIESQGYCNRMMNIKVKTNITNENCYYSYNYLNITICLNKNQELLNGNINNIFVLSSRELREFARIINYWF